MKTYRQSPVQMARYFQSEGLNKIHFVDLNASKSLNLVNEETLDSMLNIGMQVQYGGGVRSTSLVDKLFNKGVEQVIIGLSGQNIMNEAIKKYGANKILLGIKTMYDKLVTEQKGIKNALDYVETMGESPVEYIAFKDILSEGVMIHPNYDMVEKMTILSGKKLYISGGISEIKHLQILKKNNVYGAIVGRAFYEKELSIRQAIKVC